MEILNTLQIVLTFMGEDQLQPAHLPNYFCIQATSGVRLHPTHQTTSLPRLAPPATRERRQVIISRQITLTFLKLTIGREKKSKQTTFTN
ncbi:hypothetical protein E2C01_044295 [Portunus trituberculatus]|uniref:Uncharacterized protein n=1 Tax=Portunus trituberculatus TaxID=210409 RepID=A0A5B7FY15_PORTR|nr:hypothetical protein [Portunus trituberculatus]